jgi:hypothetical protein
MESKHKSTSLNSKNESLTVEKLRSFKGFENISDEEAIEIVFALQTLANILYDLINDKSEDNQFKRAA